MSIIQKKTFNDLYNKVRNHEKSTITNPRYDGRIQYLFLLAIYFNFQILRFYYGSSNIVPKDGERF